ncbi:MAG: LysM peptidoglycan-binding domain-containing protein, partial [Thermovirgaceae bacterium]|nr:LysM peptidoglycan-binding domain-containing protein [Thermovirgaceae bacterium]
MPYVPRQLLSFMIFILVFFMAPSGSLEASSLPWIEHRVNPGDTVETIALSYGIDSFSIRRANEMPENVIPSARSVILVPRDKSLLIETRAEVRARSSGGTTADLYSHEEDNRDHLPETTGTDAGQGMTALSGVFSPQW